MLKCDFLGLAGKSWMLKTETAFVLAILQADIQALERKKVSTRHQQPFNTLDTYFLSLVLRTDHLESESFSLNLPPFSTAMLMLSECF